MKPQEFCYWLQGYFELSNESNLNRNQIEIIKNHLDLVFYHSIDEPDPTGKLQEIHDGETNDLITPQSQNATIRC